MADFMNYEEKCVRENKVFGGKIVNLYVDEISLPDGSRSVREYISHSGGAAVLFIKDEKVALVRQYRYAYREETLEIPAGKLNEGEDPRLAALRELEEETGYRASESRHLLDIYPTPGYTNEVIHVYLVTRAEFVGERLDEGEFLNCEYYDISEVERLIGDGKIKDAKTVSAVLKYSIDKNKGLI